MTPTGALISHERLLEMLSYDPETGVFLRRKGIRHLQVGSQAGATTTRGYLRIQLDGKCYFAHRLAWFYVHGKWPDACIDHVNGVTSDNRISNLRDVSTIENGQNRKRPLKTNKLGFLGVSQQGPRFRAAIVVNKKRMDLGHFRTPEEAHAAHLAARRRYMPGNTL